MAKKKTATKKKKTATNIKITLPFSKQNIVYARLEAYVFSLILIILVCFDKDVSAIAILLSLAWGGYKALQAFYLWMAKHEHLMDKQIEMKKLELDASRIESELEDLKHIDVTDFFNED